MRLILIAACLACLVGCDSTTQDPIEEQSSAEMPAEDQLFLMPIEGGNTFACNTCHALEEPAGDGFRRVGHALGDATRRPSWKNGALDNMRTRSTAA